MNTGQSAAGAQTSTLYEDLNSRRQRVLYSLINTNAPRDQMQIQLDQYEAHLDECLNQHQELMTRLETFVLENKKGVEFLQKEKSDVQRKKSRNTELVNERQIIKQSLSSPNTPREIFLGLEKAEKYSADAEEWRQECLHRFPDISNIHTSEKVRKVAEKVLDLVDRRTRHGTAGAHNYLTGTESTIMEKVHRLSKIVPVAELKPLSNSAKALLESGKVMSVCRERKSVRYTHLTFANQCLHLHAFLCKPSITDPYTIEYGALIDLWNSTSSNLTFLDLSWGGSFRGRLFIKLYPNTATAKQFFLLCMGKRGPSYRNTRFFKSSPTRISGGDYELNTGEGGASLMQGLNESYILPASRGLVYAPYYNSGSRSAQFTIITQATTTPQSCTVIGQVEQGIEIAQAAGQQPNSTVVTVSDCGVVVPL